MITNMAPSDAHPARYDFPFDGYTHRPLPGRRPGAGEGLSSSRHHLPYVPRPITAGVPQRCDSRIFTPSVAFALILRARLPLGPLTGLGLRRGRLRFMLRTARLLPPCGFRRWAPTPEVSLRRRQPATRLHGDYLDGTFTRWR